MRSENQIKIAKSIKMEQQKKAEEVKVLSSSGKARMGIKVCGMKYERNIQDVAELQPDFMGFIFYEKSPRFMENPIPEINTSIKKTGVFVNASLKFIQQKINEYDLQAVQLHGQESPEFCRELKEMSHRACPGANSASKHKNDKSDRGFDKLSLTPWENEMSDQQGKDLSAPLLEVIKVFSIKDDFNFQELAPYLSVVDYFLFDTKGKHHGGNGETFNWKVLENYPFEKPFFLSGGIGLEEVDALQLFRQKNLPLYRIDVNSKFETEPGEKNVEKLKEFKNKLNL